eukprot:COSAG04_NODE_5734_length_1508_cov_1.157559_1_plen_79_part_10
MCHRQITADRARKGDKLAQEELKRIDARIRSVWDNLEAAQKAATDASSAAAEAAATPQQGPSAEEIAAFIASNATAHAA